MRIIFEEELLELNNELIKMGKLCEKAITSAIDALLTGDPKMREQAVETDKLIDVAEKDIESLCMQLLLRQQPVARDLRSISAALKMISDMERIGDQSTDIAEITRHINVSDDEFLNDIKKMSKATIKMVTDSVESFVNKDLSLAQKVFKEDDDVDAYFDKTKNDLISQIAVDGGRGEYYLDMLMIAKYLERIGDHATNIAGWVKYTLTGRH